MDQIQILRFQRFYYYFFVACFSRQCLHRPEVHDDVDAGAAGRLHPGVQTGVSVALLALLRQRLYNLPLPRAGQINP